MAIRIRAPRNKATATYIRSLFLNAENEIVHEIMRKRASGYVDYAEVATLGRIRATLQGMVDESWQYVPKMVEKYFYTGEGPAKGYASAWKMQRATPGRIHLIELLSDNLLGEIGEMATTAYIASQTALADLATLAGGSVPIVGPMTPGPLRSAILNMTAATQAIGESPVKLTDRYLIAMQQSGITAFVDKSGRAWSLRNYGDMAVRTTSRQAAVAELLTRDDEQDLYMISSIGSTCPVCAPLEGRVYSKSGMDPNYPPLSLAFGKIDPTGPDDLSNTYLNIHPNCLVPGGSVLGEGIVAESRRLYRGEVVTLNTAGGDKITVTPNHPILTDRGFIPACRIKEGDKVVKTTGEYARLIGEAPNNVYIDSGVDEIFHALMKSSGGASSTVKGSSEQFHGDGIADEEVNIIFSDSLGNGIGNLMRVKKLRKKSFPSGRGRRILLFADGTFTKRIIGKLASLYGGVRRLGFVGGIKLVSKDGEKFSNLRNTTPAFLSYLSVCKTGIVEIEHLRKKLRVSFLKVLSNVGKFPAAGSVPDNSEFGKYAEYLRFSDSAFLGNLRDTEPIVYKRLKFLFANGAAVFESVNHVDTSYYDGYVYNFETKLNYYVYNNIVTHNCLHSLVPYTELGKTPKQVERIRNFSNPETNPLDRDPRSKKQIEAYREKERNRAAYLREFKKKQKARLERQMAKAAKESEATN